MERRHGFASGRGIRAGKLGLVALRLDGCGLGKQWSEARRQPGLRRVRGRSQRGQVVARLRLEAQAG